MKSWEEQIELPERDPEIEYAYILKSVKKPVKCGRETLYSAIEKNKEVEFVTTPYDKNFIIPGTDFLTLQPLLRKRKKAAKFELKLALFYGGMFLLTGLITGDLFDNFLGARSFDRLQVMIFSVIPIIHSIYEQRSIRSIDQFNYHSEALRLKFHYWINTKRVYSVYIAAGILCAITLVQFLTGPVKSVEAAGLVNEKVFSGEYWRLLTNILLHGHIFHIIFNALALFALGKMVIRITNFSYFLIVFLFSGIFGSLFSLWLPPDATSVGASGGILGLLGFLLIIGIKFRDSFPGNLTRVLIMGIIFTMVLGAVSADLIDNAAHAGGLTGGIILGLIMIRAEGNIIPYKSSFTIDILGFISAGILISGVGGILYLLI